MEKLRLVLLFVLLSSCNFNGNVSFDNEEEEKENAQSVAALFYLYIAQNNHEKATGLFSDSFFKVDSKEKLLKTLSRTNELLGEFKDYKLEDWKTRRTKGSDAKTEYLLVYEVKYSKFTALEKISLIKDGELIKIIGYNISSEGFLYTDLEK